MPAETMSTEMPVQMRRLDPRVRVLWRVRSAISSLPWLVTALVTDLVLPLALPTPTGVVSGGVLAVALLGVVVTPSLRYRRWAYAVEESSLWIRQGLLRVTTTVIPFRRLQFVDTSHGPLERMLGLAEVVVHTASPGTAGRLVGLERSEAEHIRDHLADLVAVDDVL